VEFLHPDDIPRTRTLRTFRYNRTGFAVMLVLFGAGPVWGLREAWPSLGALPILGWLVAGPLLLLAAGLYAIVNSFLANGLVASFLPCNWVLKTSVDGVFLQFRSYLNHRFEGSEPTVVFLRFDELDQAGKVVERVERGQGEREHTAMVPYLELRLKSKDTDALLAAVTRERQREGVESRFLGVTTRTRANHVPVLVPEPGVVRVEWRPGMLRALERSVEIAPKRTIGVGGERREGGRTDDEILEHLKRGDKIGAVGLVREAYGMETTEAVEFVESMES